MPKKVVVINLWFDALKMCQILRGGKMTLFNFVIRRKKDVLPHIILKNLTKSLKQYTNIIFIKI